MLFKAWNIAYQVPIYKGGNIFDTNNFRGISITSCLGKIFNKALNNRLQEEVENNLYLKDTQAAYRHNYSTTDQIFILNSLVNKYVKAGKKKLFVCFIDFKKAFDNVWHTGLLYKLINQYSIGGKFYTMIKSMYKNAKTSVKLSDGVTNVFNLEKGIKQGDTLSPFLFNLFLNDVNNIFSSSKCASPSLFNRVVNCLLYADDLLVVSETKSGLQHALNELHSYCITWKLQLNIKKTKVIVFNTRKSKEQYTFMFGQDKISICDQCAYLGIIFNKNGNFKDAVHLLKEKGNKAMFVLRGALYTGITFQPDLPLKVFDSTVRPILVYGSEVWCIEYLKLLTKTNLLDKAPFETIL